MTPMFMSELIDITHGKLLAGNIDGCIEGVSVDTRTLSPHDAYIAFKGEHVDGHQFVLQAVKNGASAILVTKPISLPNEAIPVILIDNPLSAIQALAIYERQSFHGPVVGVTGSNGKTTTKEMLGAVFQAMGPCLFTKANQNNELGLPLTILQRNPVHCSMVLEMGMRGMGQIESLCEIAQPTAGIITNIGPSHLELLGSQERIASAKAELLDALGHDGVCVLPSQDQWAHKVAQRFHGSPLWYDVDDQVDAYATNICITDTGTLFLAHVLGYTDEVFIPSFGRHNVANALGALLLGAAHNLLLADMAYFLAQMTIMAGRLTIQPGRNNWTVIDDCYNASPISVKANVDVLIDVAVGSTAVILGDMFELGSYTMDGHREVGAYVAKKNIDVIIAIGEHAKTIADESTRMGGSQVYFFDSINSALPSLDICLPPKSTILVKASHGMHFERIVTYLVGENR